MTDLGRSVPGGDEVISYSIVRDETMPPWGGANWTGAGPSLLIGRKGSRFAWTKTGPCSRRGEDTVMLGTRESPEDVMVVDARGLDEYMELASNGAIISTSRLLT